MKINNKSKVKYDFIVGIYKFFIHRKCNKFVYIYFRLIGIMKYNIY